MIGTQDAGYLTKKFFSAYQSIQCDEPGTDCGSKKGIEFILSEGDGDSFDYQYSIEGSKYTLITPENRSKYIGKKVKLRSPMYCSGDKLCSICAGKRWEIMGIKNMGLTAGRITNTLLNASMKNFHNAKVKVDHVNVNDLISGSSNVKELAYSSDGNNIIVNVPYAEVYIPDEIVGDPSKGNPVAYNYGEGVRAIGLFNIRFFSSEDENRDKPKLCVFKYPNEITMYPTDRETRNLKLDKNLKEDKYLILKFYQGDVIMSSNIEKKSQKCESFMNQLIMGKLPKGLSYDDLYFAWEKNFKINGIDPGVPAIIKQMIIAENCRVAGDPSKQFRKVVNNPGVTLYDYEVHNMVDICANSSVMNALIFERFGDMITSSLNMTKEGVKQNTTPLEEVLYV